MPKQKTRRAAAKRFKVTGSGRVLRRRGSRSHLLRKKSASRKRRLDRPAEVPRAHRQKVARQLGD